jgi:glyoxylase-like metal-dependent hydrolase (beta-lactamase superfamily II)
MLGLAPRVDVQAIRTSRLGDTTDILSHIGRGGVVDPQRDAERFLDAGHAQGIHIRYLLETHVHNDYVAVVQLQRIGFDRSRGVTRGMAAWRQAGYDVSSYNLTDASTFARAVIGGNAAPTPALVSMRNVITHSELRNALAEVPKIHDDASGRDPHRVVTWAQ